MTGALAFELTFDADEVAALALRVSGSDSRSVLGLRPRHATVDVREAAYSRAANRLTERGVIVDGLVGPEVVAALRVIQRPDRELTLRLVTPVGMARVRIARRGSLCVLARRVDELVVIRVVGSDVALSEVSAVLLAEMPSAAAAAVEPVGAPLEDVTEALSDTHDPLLLADRIRALGAAQRAAVHLGAALGTRRAFAEVVFSAIRDGDDLMARVPAAIGVFYTARGRVIAVPSRSPAGQLWTTLKPGTDQVFGQAVDQLVELSAERWGS